MLVKFGEIRMVKNVQKFEHFDRKPVFLYYSWQIVNTILEDVSVAETIVEC